jgi:plasmid stabilization system protein ParE
VSTIPVRFHPAALAEAEAAYRWYRERSPSASAAFRSELDRAVAQLAEAPEWPASYLHGTRRLLLRRFPYALVYRIAEAELEVIAVAHLRRRPGDWAGR